MEEHSAGVAAFEEASNAIIAYLKITALFFPQTSPLNANSTQINSGISQERVCQMLRRRPFAQL